MMRGAIPTIASIALLCSAAAATSQQGRDSTFDVRVAHPAFLTVISLGYMFMRT
jgi:hypothetical protein